jgi:hypothetical protein
MLYAILMIVTNFCIIDPDGQQLCLLQNPNMPVNVVYECAYSGDPTVPLHINTGTQNPGPGVVYFLSRQNGVHTKDREAELVLSFKFDSRGAVNGTTVIYTIDTDLLSDSFESITCACHATDVDAERGCPNYGSPPSVQP